MHSVSAVALAAVSTLVAGPSAEDRRPDAARIQGSWKEIYCIIDGRKVVPYDMTGRPYDIRCEGDRYVTARAMGTFRLDTTKEPKVIERTFLTDPWKGMRWDALYRLEGDRLWLCQGGAGKPAPARFAAPRGSGVVIYVYERVRLDGR